MAKIYDLTGNVKGEIKLPAVFKESYRPDLIKRAVLAMHANKRQPFGADTLAGKRTSAHYHGSRHVDGRVMMMNREMARLPRTHRSSAAQNFRARFAPQTRGGREAHPPKVEKIWDQKVNKKEKRLAVCSAIAATAVAELVKKHGHIFELDLPIIVSDDMQAIKKTKDLKKVLLLLKLENELERAKRKKVKAGKKRGRKYKKKKSVLIVISEDEGIAKAAKNISGVDICQIQNLNAELLAPGAQAGRLVVWSESSIGKLDALFK